MLTTRQEKVLEIIIREYVKSVTPVGSKLICDELGCSSATVRNEMAVLENEGFLEKTHISSGRVPSENGYRYYVDNLMKPKEMTGEEMLKLQTIFSNNKLAINEVVRRSLEIVSELTDYTSVVLGSQSNENRLQKVEVLPLDDKRLVAIIVTDKGHIEHRQMENLDVSLDEVSKTVELINKLIVGTPINEIKEKLEFEIKPIINRYVKQHEALYNAFYDVFNEFAINNDVSFVGRTKILNQPEFNNVEKIKKVFNKLDDENLLKSIEEDDKDINIYIGNESNVQSMKDCSIVTASYEIEEGVRGTIGIIGPKRMDYEKVLETLNTVRRELDNKLKKEE